MARYRILQDKNNMFTVQKKSNVFCAWKYCCEFNSLFEARDYIWIKFQEEKPKKSEQYKIIEEH